MRRGCVVVAASLFALACGSRIGDGRQGRHAVSEAPNWRDVLAMCCQDNGHAKWVEIEETQVAGFAGWYLSERPYHPIVLVKDPANAAGIPSAMAPLLRAFQEERVGLPGYEAVTVDHIEMRAVKHSIAELYRWYAQIANAPFEVSIVVDVASNQLVVRAHVEHDEFQAHLGDSGIPSDAVRHVVN